MQSTFLLPVISQPRSQISPLERSLRPQEVGSTRKKVTRTPREEVQKKYSIDKSLVFSPDSVQRVQPPTIGQEASGHHRDAPFHEEEQVKFNTHMEDI